MYSASNKGAKERRDLAESTTEHLVSHVGTLEEQIKQLKIELSVADGVKSEIEMRYVHGLSILAFFCSSINICFYSPLFISSSLCISDQPIVYFYRYNLTTSVQSKAQDRAAERAV